MDPIFEHIKIGPYRFEVNERNVEWMEKNAAHGTFDTLNLQINVVTENRDKIVILDTLLHEILHGIYYLFQLSKGDSEERVVSALSTGLLTVLIDNPEIIKYIQRTVSAKT